MQSSTAAVAAKPIPIGHIKLYSRKKIGRKWYYDLIGHFDPRKCRSLGRYLTQYLCELPNSTYALVRMNHCDPCDEFGGEPFDAELVQPIDAANWLNRHNLHLPAELERFALPDFTGERIQPATEQSDDRPAMPAMTLPEFMSARDLARHLDVPYHAFRKRLERLERRLPDCAREVEGRRAGEPAKMYRVADVLEHVDPSIRASA